MRFENKVLFVTGGASGLGAATGLTIPIDGGYCAR
jgi:NAD(P)-dependent dehydrogenase (short-subunit alcohol dehydrogenase family)